MSIYHESPNELNEIIMIPFILLRLPITQVHNNRSHTQQYHYRHVYDIIHPLIIP